MIFLEILKHYFRIQEVIIHSFMFQCSSGHIFQNASYGQNGKWVDGYN